MIFILLSERLVEEKFGLPVQQSNVSFAPKRRRRKNSATL
jgi:hypothetical protein